ncbi:MAG: DUF1415 domain-containing protein [Bacteroidota bacterium]
MEAAAVIQHTATWVEKMVIGLNLCPFAGPVFRKDGIRYQVSEARGPEVLWQDLLEELLFLAGQPAKEVETTLLIHPEALGDFADYLDFVEMTQDLLIETELEGVLQIATFHPDYQFDGTAFEAAENFSNRAPYPMLHLLREERVAAAVEGHPDPEGIPAENIRKLSALGQQKLSDLRESCFSS